MYEPPLEGAPLGGVQLDVEPRRAQVFVDGSYAGLVEEFSGYFHHLEVPAGPHDISIVADGYEPLSLHVIVSPGAWEGYFRGRNPEGKTLRELANPIRCPDEFRDPAQRVRLLDEQGLAAAMIFPSLVLP